MRYHTIVTLLAFALVACDKPAQQGADTAAPPPQTAEQTPADGVGPSPQHGMVTTTAIVITDSGSTNTIGYRIVVGANGEASYVTGDGRGNATLPADLFAKLRGDVDAAKPLAALPSGACMKPASFGSSVYVAMGGDRSSDLSCPGNDAAQALKDDVDAVVAFLKIRNTPRSEGKELPPQNQ
jgi:hypothetical protein